jgi:hypothetical protein
VAEVGMNNAVIVKAVPRFLRIVLKRYQNHVKMFSFGGCLLSSGVHVRKVAALAFITVPEQSVRIKTYWFNTVRSLKEREAVMMLCKSISRNMILAFVLWLLLAGVSIVVADSTVLSAKEVQALIPEFEASEERLLNIKVKAEVWTEESASRSGPWERGATYINATSWLEDGSARKIRMDVDSEVTEGYWFDQARFLTEEKGYKVSFDGTQGRVIYDHETMEGGRTRPLKKGEILNDVPQMLKFKPTNLVTGMPLTMQGYFFYNKEMDSFSRSFGTAGFRQAIEMKAVEFSRETYDGIPCIRFSSKGQPSLRVSYWFDPNRGLALLGYENVSIAKDGKEFVNERIRINKLEKVADGLWWPLEAVIESDKQDQRKKDLPYQRIVFHATDVVANDPNFDNGTFSISFPEGYTVENKINGTTYISSGKN